MIKRMLARGVKKYVRKEKARLRREISDSREYKQAVKELYERLAK